MKEVEVVVVAAAAATSAVTMGVVIGWGVIVDGAIVLVVRSGVHSSKKTSGTNCHLLKVRRPTHP